MRGEGELLYQLWKRTSKSETLLMYDKEMILLSFFFTNVENIFDLVCIANVISDVSFYLRQPKILFTCIIVKLPNVHTYK